MSVSLSLKVQATETSPLLPSASRSEESEGPIQALRKKIDTKKKDSKIAYCYGKLGKAYVLAGRMLEAYGAYMKANEHCKACIRAETTSTEVREWVSKAQKHYLKRIEQLKSFVAHSGIPL